LWCIHGDYPTGELPACLYWVGTSLLQPKGTLGLIATNTVAQGDTRQVGLDAMVADGFTITRAIQSRSWPAASANLEYAAVWGTRAEISTDIPRVADGVAVRAVSTLLEPAGRVDGNPLPLQENAGISFIGCYVLGMGFVVEPSEAQEWIAADARNTEVLFPYLNGEDLNSRPDASASRWVIDFNNRPQAEAATYLLPFGRVADQVKDERQRKPKAVREAPWWLFLRARPAMRRATADLSEVLVLAQVSNTAQPVFVPNHSVPSHKLIVFASDSRSLLACLASSVHYVWARKYSGAMKNDLSYSPSDVFLTFPRPPSTPRLALIGAALDEERREIMLRRNIGLTQIYNLVHDYEVRKDADVNRLREIHVEVDAATSEAYGWDDLHLGHGFHAYRQSTRWTVSSAARIELVDRLLEENLRRASALSQVQIQARTTLSTGAEDTLFP
jgi:hypothetical protein